MKTIKLYGYLGEQFGKEHSLAVNSPREAVKALSVLYPGFIKAITQHTGPGFRVVTDRDLKLEEALLHTDRDTIKIIPVIAGAGDDGFFEILLGGALLIMAGIPSIGFEGLLAESMGGFLTQVVSSIGTSLLMGGVSRMLFDPPDNNDVGGIERAENKPSYSFDGAVNTVTQGNPVALAYGRIMAGSQLVSAGMYTENIPL